MNPSFNISRALLATLTVLVVCGISVEAEAQQASGLSLGQSAETRLSSVGPSVLPATHLAPTTLPPSLQNYRPQTEPTALAAGPTVGVMSPIAAQSQGGSEARPRSINVSGRCRSQTNPHLNRKAGPRLAPSAHGMNTTLRLRPERRRLNLSTIY